MGDLSNKAAYVAADGRSFELKLDEVKKKRSGLEAVAYDPSQRRLFVSSEETNELLRYRLSFGSDGTPSAKLESVTELELGGRSNKGVEGLAFLPGQH